jgi:hypothetical protein
MDNAGNLGPNPNSTLRRWQRCEYNSTHNAIPPDWITQWNVGMRHCRQFELLCGDGLHTVEALRLFIAGAAAAAGPTPLSLIAHSGNPLSIGELDGTCAFKTRAEAWKYVLGDANNPASLMKVKMTWVVEFRGIDLDINIPEAQGGGVQVKVVHPGTPVNANLYAQLHGLNLPPEEEEGDVELPFDTV